MTDGEIAYLALVVVFFIAFLAIVGGASMTQSERRDE